MPEFYLTEVSILSSYFSILECRVGRDKPEKFRGPGAVTSSEVQRFADQDAGYAVHAGIKKVVPAAAG